jgi:hypothetical protein
MLGASVNNLIYAVSVEALLSLEGIEFIECCFQTILNRQPTSSEKKDCIKSYKSRSFKMDLIERLVDSTEGSEASIGLSGLGLKLKQFKQSKLPIVGWFFSIFHVFRNRHRKPIPADQFLKLTPRAQSIFKKIESESRRYQVRRDAG